MKLYGIWTLALNQTEWYISKLFSILCQSDHLNVFLFSTISTAWTIFNWNNLLLFKKLEISHEFKNIKEENEIRLQLKFRYKHKHIQSIEWKSETGSTRYNNNSTRKHAQFNVLNLLFLHSTCFSWIEQKKMHTNKISVFLVLCGIDKELKIWLKNIRIHEYCVCYKYK